MTRKSVSDLCRNRNPVLSPIRSLEVIQVEETKKIMFTVDVLEMGKLALAGLQAILKYQQISLLE